MNQTFQQKRIVQLSKKLDQQRQRCESLVKETHDQAKQIEFLRESFQNEQSLKQQMQLSERQLKSEISSLSQQVASLREQKSIMQKKLIEAEYSTMRIKQLMQQQKQEHSQQVQKMKEQIFGLEQVIAQKDKENMKLRQENLQLQKMYLNKRSQMQVHQEKHFRQLSKLAMDFQALKNELAQMTKIWQGNLEKEKGKVVEMTQEFQEKVKQVEARIQETGALRKNVSQLEEKLQEVVVENSQRIIELYNVKYNMR